MDRVRADYDKEGADDSLHAPHGYHQLTVSQLEFFVFHTPPGFVFYFVMFEFLAPIFCVFFYIDLRVIAFSIVSRFTALSLVRFKKNF